MSAVDRLVSYFGAEWVGCPTTLRPTFGVCVYLGDNLISSSSKQQDVVSSYSVEAKYRGVANGVKTAWLQNLLLELSYPLSCVTLVFCDNVNTMYLTSNLVQHQRTKHVAIDLHFVRERVFHVPSACQYAYNFTKSLPIPLFL